MTDCGCPLCINVSNSAATSRTFSAARFLAFCQVSVPNLLIGAVSTSTLNKNNYSLFSNDFPFEETPDQALSITNVISDMCSDQAMDRLVCGDVGFGKTEVAMRAAFIATDNQRQVAILVPTTLLAQQHYENFTDRFADWPMWLHVVHKCQVIQRRHRVPFLLRVF
jgi:transcription-repair coupling factor (superfamily II helicase)